MRLLLMDEEEVWLLNTLVFNKGQGQALKYSCIVLGGVVIK